MPVFQYKGRNQNGESVSGLIDAVTVDAVATQLLNNRVTPIDIVESTPVANLFGAFSKQMTRRAIAPQELALLCRQMYTLLKAGVPILSALRGLRESAHNHELRRVLGNLQEGLDAGQSLGASLARHPEVFSTLFVALVQVGETTGTLPESFLRLAKHLELEKETRDRVVAALRYPVFVMLTMVAAVFVINMFVIPAFAKLYAGFNIELPWATRLLIATSDFTVRFWPLMLLVAVGAALAIRSYVGTEAGRYQWHRYKLRLPIVGSIIFRATMARFASALAVTSKSGVPIVQGLGVVSRAVDNAFVSARVVRMREGVERGETIARTAAATGMFPPLVLQMIAVGEDTGAIDRLMEDVSEYYDREVDYDLKNLAAALEPILIVFVGILVFILALGIFLPMWDLAQVARPGGG